MMAVDLPDPVARYFAADREHGADGVARLFADDAVVKDEGHTYFGREAIRQWKTDSSAKYSYTSEPFAIATEGDQIIVTSHLVGDFPGSPVDLRYIFRLKGAEIAALEIGL
jgi:ketosteroid isomerase-like protein